MAKTKDGRLKCSTELMAEISRHLLAGASMKSTARSVGIDYSTLKRWLAWEGEGKEPFATLCAPLKKARYEAIGNAEQAGYEGKHGWQAKARWLESIYPEQWQRSRRTETTHQGGGKPVPIDLDLGAALLRTMIEESARPGVPGLAPPGGERFCGTGRN
jgi:hypothetical protein